MLETKIDTTPTVPESPWTTQDAWLGTILVIFATLLFVAAAILWNNRTFFETVGLPVSQALLAIPVIFFVIWRKAGWQDLGFRRFNTSFLVLGCGLLLISFLINIVNNLIFTALGLDLQAEDFLNFFKSTQSPQWLIFSGIIGAPFVEEPLFRGFLFAGFRQKYGWKWAAIISSGIFALGHFSFAALIPTFTLGMIFCILYQQSKSIWPGILMHMTINSLSLCGLLLLSKLQPTI